MSTKLTIMNKSKIVITLALLSSFTTIISAQNKADLIVVEIGTPEWNDGSYIKIELKNIGKAESAPVKLNVWDLDVSVKEAKKIGVKRRDMWIFQENSSYSEDGSSDYDENWELLFDIPVLQPGESHTVTVFMEHWVFDPNCEIGTWIDFDSIVPEANEKNNKLYFYMGG